MAKKQTQKKNNKMFTEKFRRKIVSYRSIMVIGFASIIVVVLLIGYKSMLAKEQAYQESIDALTTDVESLEETNASLKEELKNMDTDEFKEKTARERLGMIGKNEVLLKESTNGVTGRGAPEEETTESTEETTTESTENTESSETTEALSSTEMTEATQGTDTTEAIEGVENSESTEDTMQSEENY